MKVNRKKWGPGAIPGCWQPGWIGSAPPVKTAVRSRLNLLSAISRSSLPFPVWTWKTIGARALTVDGSAARGGVFIYSESWRCLFRMRFLAGSSVPTPGFDHFSKKKKKKEILDCLRPPHWHGATQVTCLCLEGVPVAPWEEGLEKSGRPPAGPAPQMCWGAVIIIRRLK